MNKKFCIDLYPFKRHVFQGYDYYNLKYTMGDKEINFTGDYTLLLQIHNADKIYFNVFKYGLEFYDENHYVYTFDIKDMNIEKII